MTTQPPLFPLPYNCAGTYTQWHDDSTALKVWHSSTVYRRVLWEGMPFAAAVADMPPIAGLDADYLESLKVQGNP